TKVLENRPPSSTFYLENFPLKLRQKSYFWRIDSLIKTGKKNMDEKIDSEFCTILLSLIFHPNGFIIRNIIPD
ncbi:hypothetical protein C6A36_02410, partial [Desulfobacteraceae bacterium SEEP-SAG10]